MGVNYKALALWEEQSERKNRDWYTRRGKEVPEAEVFDIPGDDSGLEILRSSNKVPRLLPSDAAVIGRIVKSHGFASVLRELYLLANEKRLDAEMAYEMDIDAPDASPFIVLADKLDEIAGSREAAIK